MEPKINPHPGQIQGFLRYLAIATALLFIISISIGVSGYIVNRHRINDIQLSRTSSCEHTYIAFREVFKPFILPAKLQTPKEKHDLIIFYKTINQLVKRCIFQTAIKE